MKALTSIIALFSTLGIGIALFGQAGPGRSPIGDPAFDISGYWSALLMQDSLERGGGGEIADYGGYPVNEAGRLFGLSYDPSRYTLRHHQCQAFTVGYEMRTDGNARAWEERDPHTQQLIAIHWYNQINESHRIIWMDGRPHPPSYAAHSWMGFSTGKFVGNTLVVTTTHLKQGFAKRNGLPQSDQATAVEYLVRHGDHLTYTSVIADPVFATEPIIATADLFRQPVDHESWHYDCDDGEQILGRKPDQVPSYLFGQNSSVREYGQKYKIPLGAHLGGAETMYPDYLAKVKSITDADGLAKTRPGVGPSQISAALDTQPRDGEIHVLPIRDNVYMLAGEDSNIVVQVGDEGPFVVDTGAGELADKVIAAIRKLSPKPIQFIANTSFRSDHTGGNVKLRDSGDDPTKRGHFFGGPNAGQNALADSGATIIAHQNVQNHMLALQAPSQGIPIDTFLEERRRKFQNGDEIEMFWQQNAVTDADSIVHFRRASVIATGDIFTTTQYPFIDVKAGGSVQGEIKALNDILDRTVYEHFEQGGTLIVPGHGYLCDEHEVADYRDMVVIVRDRVKAMIDSGASLEQVKAARVTADYDPRYGANSGAWTTNMFVEAVYTSLKQRAASVGNGRN